MLQSRKRNTSVRKPCACIKQPDPDNINEWIKSMKKSVTIVSLLILEKEG